MQMGAQRKPAAGTRIPIYIIDDDASVRTALERLLISAGIRARTFAGAREFLDAGRPPGPACVITDVKMHGMTGLDLHRHLAAAGERVHFIFVTAYGRAQAQHRPHRRR
jgi:FixJ family two-component response regulator